MTDKHATVLDCSKDIRWEGLRIMKKTSSVITELGTSKRYQQETRTEWPATEPVLPSI